MRRKAKMDLIQRQRQMLSEAQHLQNEEYACAEGQKRDATQHIMEEPRFPTLLGGRLHHPASTEASSGKDRADQMLPLVLEALLATA